MLYNVFQNGILLGQIYHAVWDSNRAVIPGIQLHLHTVLIALFTYQAFQFPEVPQ